MPSFLTPTETVYFQSCCYHNSMFNFGRPKTSGDWIVHLAGAIVAVFLIWWMVRLFILRIP